MSLSLRVVILALSLVAAGCAIPSRDNSHDPANIPNPPAPAIAVYVEGFDTTLGQRNSVFTLDGTASTTGSGDALPAGSCWEWEIASFAADDPASIPDSGWTSVLPAGAECVGTFLVVGSAGTPLAGALASVENFQSASGVPDGTGITTRWVRLRLTTPSGGSAIAVRLLAIFNAAPVVRLGDDRRTAPGGEWKKLALTPTAFENTVRVSIEDPDPLVSVEWLVTGELATRVDIAPKDGHVDIGYVTSNGMLAKFPMSIDPSRSEITVRARDFESATIDPAAVAFGEDSMHLDVLSTVWVYNEGAGHLSRLDSSTFSSDFERIDAIVLGAAQGTTVYAAPGGAGLVQLATSGRGLGRATNRLTVPSAATNPQTVAAVPDGTGEWWVLHGGNGQFGGLANDGSLRRLDATLQNVTFGPVSSLGGTGLRSGFTGRNLAMVRGNGRRVWITGGSDSTTIGQRVMLVDANGTLPFPAIDPFDAVANEVRLLAPDGAGGVWAAEDFGPRFTHITEAGLKMEYVLPASCGTNLPIVSMVADTVLGALWLGVSSGTTERLCRASLQDLTSFAFQTVDSVGDLAIDPTNGDALMVGKNGKGISRYDFAGGSVRSLDYVPLPVNVFAQDVSFVEGSLLVNASIGAIERAYMIEGAEIHAPNNIILGVDPYLFEEVRHVADPLTGYVWVWLPDESGLALYSPAGRRVRTVTIPGATEKRGQIAFDPGGRRVWFTTSNLYVGNNTPPADGRLFFSDLPDGFDVPGEVGVPDVVVASTVPGIEIAMARGLGVVTGTPDAPGRVCLASNFLNENLATGALLRMVLDSDGTLAPETTVLTNATQDQQVWSIGNAFRDECWFGRDGPANFSVRLRLGDTPLTISHETTGRDLRRPSFVDIDMAWAAASDGTGLVLTRLTSLTSANATTPIVVTAGVATASIGSSTLDPYWQHVWLGIGLTDQPEGGEILRVSLQEAQFAEPGVEVARAVGYQTPRLSNGR